MPGALNEDVGARLRTVGRQAQAADLETEEAAAQGYGLDRSAADVKPFQLGMLSQFTPSPLPAQVMALPLTIFQLVCTPAARTVVVGKERVRARSVERAIAVQGDGREIHAAGRAVAESRHVLNQADCSAVGLEDERRSAVHRQVASAAKVQPRSVHRGLNAAVDDRRNANDPCPSDHSRRAHGYVARANRSAVKHQEAAVDRGCPAAETGKGVERQGPAGKVDCRRGRNRHC